MQNFVGDAADFADHLNLFSGGLSINNIRGCLLLVSLEIIFNFNTATAIHVIPHFGVLLVSFIIKLIRYCVYLLFIYLLLQHYGIKCGVAELIQLIGL